MNISRLHLPFIAYVALLIATLAWAGNSIAARIGVGHISPMLLTELNWLIAFICLSLFGFKQIKRDWPAILIHWRILAILGILGFALFNGCLYLGLNYTFALNASIIMASVPIFILLGGFLFLSSKVTLFQWVGVVITIGGVAVIISEGEIMMLRYFSLNIGDFIIILGCMFYAAFALLLKHRPGIHWISFLWAISLSGAIFCLPGPIMEHTFGTLIWPDQTGWLTALYIGLIPAIIAQGCFVFATDIITAGRAGLFLNLIPVFTALLAPIILGEHIYTYHFIGLGIVLVGIYLSETFASKQ